MTEPSLIEQGRASEVPFLEQLRSVPIDSRSCVAIQWDEDGRETGHSFTPYGHMIHRAAAEIERLTARVAEVEADARRYRYMRSNATFRDQNGPGLYWYLPRFLRGDEAEQLDAAIDAAMAGKEKANAEHV